MEKDKNSKVIAIIALLIAIAGLSVGFAALSTTLTINGSGTVNTSSWNVKFANLGATPALTGTATEVTKPVLSDTKIETFDVSFMTPGDSITYTFDVANTGTYDARISSVTVPTPTCTGTGDSATTDADNVCKYLTYSLTYDNGTAVAANDVLAQGATKHLKLTLAYGTGVTSDELPVANVTISGLEIPIIYVQQ